LEWWVEARSARRQALNRSRTCRRDYIFVDGLDEHSHPFFEVLKACNESIVVSVFEAYSLPLIQTVEVLDGSNDRLGTVMGEDIDSHGETSLLGSQEQLKAD